MEKHKWSFKSYEKHNNKLATMEKREEEDSVLSMQKIVTICFFDSKILQTCRIITNQVVFVYPWKNPCWCTAVKSFIITPETPNMIP